jgi:formylglycine-generating enzyme required for sulfatase activity
MSIRSCWYTAAVLIGVLATGRAEDAKEMSNSIGMKLVNIPAGKFLMGSPDAEVGRFDDESPRHEVEITRPFHVGKYEVTRGQFRRFVEDTGYQTEAERDGSGSTYDADKRVFANVVKGASWRQPGFEQTDEHPVVNVSWNDTQAFCAWLSRKEGRVYRLPTEAEWEYACRAGTKSRFPGGDGLEELARAGNVADRSLKEKWDYSHLPNKTSQKIVNAWFETVSWNDGYPFTSPVGKFQANAFGLHDMIGNVWEWCADGYDKDYYQKSPGRDPHGPDGITYHVRRGGSFDNAAQDSRCATRGGRGPALPHNNLGFRVVCMP